MEIFQRSRRSSRREAGNVCRPGSNQRCIRLWQFMGGERWKAFCSNCSQLSRELQGTMSNSINDDNRRAKQNSSSLVRRSWRPSTNKPDVKKRQRPKSPPVSSIFTCGEDFKGILVLSSRICNPRPSRACSPIVIEYSKRGKQRIDQMTSRSNALRSVSRSHRCTDDRI